MSDKRSCPQCGGDNIYYRQVDAKAVGETSMDLLPGTGSFFHWPKLDEYVCGDCGHIRFFVPEENLHQIREKWKRAEILPAAGE